MEIRHLRYFQTIYQQGSFTKAADALFISQPALSKAMHELEAELGITLLDRHRRPLTLTDGGRVLKEFIQNLEIQQRALINTLDDLKQGEGGIIHIGLPPLVSSTVVVDILAQYRQLHPKIQLTIHEVGGKEVIKRVVDGSLDAGFAVFPLTEDDLEAIPVWKEPLDAVIPRTHRYAKQTRLSWADLDRAPLLLYREDYALFDTILDQCTQHHATPEIMQTSSEWDFLGRMAAAGLGIAIIPRSLCHRLVSPTICVMPLDPTVDWSVALVRPVHAYHSHATEYLWKLTRTMTL
jgi:DNA-binding transcriptional LysR family regulator